ncbi:unnamed protein product [Notodromas monacha]|uniref:RING-type domain-containing protein n=1 Tax=Notodromas monacha TaxID=399045 RepID=A0A7R9BGQ3_9CRUS|nr:unnamed protein product [Notodromas monacha]CAG0915166.1 unnamed protein product [Notodromas monacha]
MTFLQWRKFNFFDVARDGDLIETSETARLKDARVTACVSGSGQIVIGDAAGNIYFISRSLEVASFKAYNLCTSHIVVHPQHNYMITVGEDEVGINPLIKVWSLEKQDPHTGNPLCRRISRALPNNRPLVATALAVDPDLVKLAVGFADGSVLLSRGDVTRERGNKQKVFREGEAAVTGLAFQNTARTTYLFVVTKDSVWSYNLVSKDKEIKVQLDDFGVPSKCVALADGRHEHHLILGHKDAVYCYSPDSRGSCFAFEGEKLMLHWFKGYLIVVTRQDADKRPGDIVSDERTTILPAGSTGITEKHMVKIYDLQNRLVAHEGPVGPGAVVGVVSEWGSVVIVMDSGKLIRLLEREVSAKLNLLFKRNLYDAAIKLAKGCGYDAEGLADIFRMYGDHLYSKGEFRAAAAQYARTVRRLEPAYVIRKFLDAQRIQELTLYLNALHDAGAATRDHTTLLLNCYTKLRDTESLDQFVASDGPGVNFDVVTAIRVCRQAGYFKHALALARKHRVHDLYLKIQLDDHGDYKEALDYIAKLPFAAVESTMKKYGGMLMEKHPDETAALLQALCTDYRPTASSFISSEAANESGCRADAEEFLHVFTHHPSHLKLFLLEVEKVVREMPPALYSALLQVYLQEWTFSNEMKDADSITQAKNAAVDLLHNKWSLMDKDQALILCQNASFKPGIVFFYERSELYSEILKLEASEGNYVGVVAACKRFGPRDPYLWVHALEIFAPASGLPESLLNEVLTQIERGKLLSPIMVLEMLSSSPTISLGMVSSYLTRALEAERGKISESEQLIEQYSAETEKMKAEINLIRTSATVFQDTKCHACNHRLELPSIHFLCKHSFHQSCFESYSDNDAECPACAPENRKLRDVIGAQESATATDDDAGILNDKLNEKFFEQLARAEDGFSVIAEYFGRGVFNKVTVVADQIAGTRKATTPSLAASSAFGADPSRPGGGYSAAGLSSSDTTQRQSEGRVRAAEGNRIKGLESVSEARLRGAEGGRGSAEPVAGASEARLRSDERRAGAGDGGGARAGEARLRLHEGTNVKLLSAVRANPENPNSLSSNLDHQGGTRERLGDRRSPDVVVASSTRVPRVEERTSLEAAAVATHDKSEKIRNPFEEDEDYDESLNPFADEGVNELERGSDGDSYNDELNPFGDS